MFKAGYVCALTWFKSHAVPIFAVLAMYVFPFTIHTVIAVLDLSHWSNARSNISARMKLLCIVRLRNSGSKLGSNHNNKSMLFLTNIQMKSGYHVSYIYFLYISWSSAMAYFSY